MTDFKQAHYPGWFNQIPIMQDNTSAIDPAIKAAARRSRERFGKAYQTMANGEQGRRESTTERYCPTCQGTRWHTPEGFCVVCIGLFKDS